MQDKILIVSIVYFNLELVKTHVDFLTTVNDRADIIILENPSSSTPGISNHCIDLVRNGKIYKYLLFDKNIGMNTFETIFNSNIIDLNDYSYVIITDGDLTVKNDDWLEEQLYIFKKYPNIYACGVKLSLENLPSLDLFPDAYKWYPPPIRITDDYEEEVTGLHLLMYKREMLQRFLVYIRKNSLNFMDVIMHGFCHNHIKLPWLRTRRAEAYHLTWDIHNNLEDEYTKIKITKLPEELWYHKKNSFFKVFEKDKMYTHKPYIKL